MELILALSSVIVLGTIYFGITLVNKKESTSKDRL